MGNLEQIKELKIGDFIAFEFQSFSDRTTIEVSEISSICSDGSFICHFLIGLKSESCIVKPEEVLAIGDLNNGTEKLKGWNGNFHFLQPEKIIEIENNEK